MDIPTYLIQLNTVSGSFHNFPESDVSGQAFSRNVGEATNVLCAMHFSETTENNHHQTTVPFHNPFDDPRFEKRSIVIVANRTKKDQQPDLKVRNKHQDNDPPTSYSPDNQPFSIQSILGIGPSTSQSSLFVDNNLHQPVEIFNATEPVATIQPQLATNSSRASIPEGTLLVSDARAKREASDKYKEARARAKAKYQVSEKGRKTRAKYRASHKGKETKARATAKYEASDKGRQARARARAKHEASDKRKIAKTINNARSNTYQSAIKKGFSEEVARKKGDLAANVKKAELSSVSVLYPHSVFQSSN
ncbi:hypothetical protein [Endozoicomonas sp. YOMI1]|uniref:hypothetical protein n=1 Tax=Endozoicomonas sp. YOMI1 TaxID=2828739 RepID=UPI002147DEA6|nr:hypothetical protein [Endozoicomonas sp. YOMI1]